MIRAVQRASSAMMLFVSAACGSNGTPSVAPAAGTGSASAVLDAAVGAGDGTTTAVEANVPSDFDSGSGEAASIPDEHLSGGDASTTPSVDSGHDATSGSSPSGSSSGSSGGSGSGSSGSSGSGSSGSSSSTSSGGSSSGLVDASGPEAASSCPAGYSCMSVLGGTLACTKNGGTFPDQTCQSSNSECTELPGSYCEAVGQGGVCIKPCSASLQ